MLQVKIYNYDKTSILAGLTDFEGLSITKNLMAGGGASFDLNLNLKPSTMDNLKKYNRVLIYDGDTVVFTGYISSWKYDSSKPDVITVVINHTLNLFAKRVVGAGITYNGNFGDSILSVFNSYCTGFGLTAGTNTGVTTGSLEFNRDNALSAMQSLAEAGEIEFYINDDDKLQVRPTIGSVLTGVKLRFNENQNNVNNILSFDFLSDGSPIANRVIGISDALVQQADSTTQEPLLEAVESFMEAKDNPNLLLLAEQRLAKIEQSREIPQIQIDTDKISPYAIGLGDTVDVALKKGQLLNLDSTYRVTSIKYDYGDTATPRVTLNFADPDSKALKPDIRRDIKKIQNSIAVLQNN
jgi:hypothetical protein